MTAEITYVYIYGSSRGMGITQKTIHGGKGISRKYLNLSVVIHVALDGWNQFCNSTACLNMNCKLKFLLLPAYIFNFRIEEVEFASL